MSLSFVVYENSLLFRIDNDIISRVLSSPDFKIIFVEKKTSWKISNIFCGIVPRCIGEGTHFRRVNNIISGTYSQLNTNKNDMRLTIDVITSLECVGEDSAF